MAMGGWKSVYEARDIVDWYEKRAKIIAIKRDERDSIMIGLFPYKKEDEFHVLDLGCGMGRQTERILKNFSNAIITAIDGSSEMLKSARSKLRRYGSRVRFLERNFENSSWKKSLGKYHVVISAGTIHHLADERKRALFQEIFQVLEEGGYFINGDMIKSRYEILNKKYYNDIWAGYIRKKTEEVLGIKRSMAEAIEKMHAALEREGDKPATIEDQLMWLQEAGFKMVECVWKYYHIAVILGIK